MSTQPPLLYQTPTTNTSYSSPEFLQLCFQIIAFFDHYQSTRALVWHSRLQLMENFDFSVRNDLKLKLCSRDEQLLGKRKAIRIVLQALPCLSKWLPYWFEVDKVVPVSQNDYRTFLLQTDRSQRRWTTTASAYSERESHHQTEMLRRSLSRRRNVRDDPIVHYAHSFVMLTIVRSYKVVRNR